MILNTQSSVSSFYLLKACVSWYFKNIIVVSFSLWVVLFKKLLFLGILNTILLIEPLKYFTCILYCILTAEQVIVVSSSIPVRKSLICLAYVIKFGLSISPILSMSVRMPLPRQFLVSLLDLWCGSILWDLQYLIVVFKNWHSLCFLGYY